MLTRAFKKNDGSSMIFNTGRSDYSKGFLEELLAFRRLLQTYPQFVNLVTLCQLIIPSRGDIDAHREYHDRVRALALDINQQFGKKVVRQIHSSMGRARYLAHLHVADVLSVPSLADGMNLVCKEGAVVGKPSMVLLLSEKTGAAEEFASDALLFNPIDTEAFVRKLFQALTMTRVEQMKRKRNLKSTVIRNDVVEWWNEQEVLFQQVWDRK